MKICLIGAGTSAIGFLYNLKNAKNIEVDIFEEGEDITERIKHGNVLRGFGGAGTFSDGKLSSSHEVGGNLTDLITIGDFYNYTDDAMNLWKQGRLFAEGSSFIDTEEFNKIAKQFKQNDLHLQYSNFCHLGTDTLQEILKEIRGILEQPNFNFYFNKKIDPILDTDGYDKVVIASGRYDKSNSTMMENLFKELCIEYTENTLDIGIRYEIPHVITKELTDKLYEFKILGYSNTEELVRTFCVNPQGYVVEETGNKEYALVNGHSYSKKKSMNTNFAILVTQKFTEPFKDAYLFGASLTQLTNKLAGDNNILLQRYGDFKQGRRTTDRRIQKGFVKPTLENASKGDLNLVLPRRTANSIENFIENLSKVIPGMNNADNLMYGLETKFYSKKPKFNEDYPFRLGDSRYYMIGDASGYTRGIVQATISGMYLADYIQHIV